ncbi:MAG: helix-turn-helix transcriptional regulator [Gracilimonas sp.]|uniref:response regulator transcription factor n=1 Tax=Gracilimonas sp. TaxID=1974203 RepID=UPI00198DE61B|nr:helix-turn-helix transcriptional regulator [Gracilimonas sp.]MBD3616903.1 helix-turn-helix transcriptional regulator [Gracilimonas sp.]
MGYLTDKELLEHYEFYTLQIEEQLINGEDFENLANKFPFFISLNNPRTFELLHVNNKHTKLTGFTFEEITEKWDEYIKVVHPNTIESIKAFLPRFYATKNENETIAFLQYVKGQYDSEFLPYITFSKPSALPEGLNLWVTVSPEDFGKKKRKIEQVIRMDEFKLKHFKRFQQLTEREVEILKLLANGCNNPEISGRLFISRSTVETHRKNLKRKLNLKSLRDLMRYAFAFDLIEV